MKAGVLVAQSSPGSLGPHHEGVHRTFDMDPLLVQPAITNFVISNKNLYCYLLTPVILLKFSKTLAEL